ncbi:MAG: purine-nucleoside phosphorylase, partial [Mycobacterium sp.]|nr:purine-nucleoside phosphorylase [Mycobacterium sp.]
MAAVTDPQGTPDYVAAQAAAAIHVHTGISTFDVAVVLGSGWAPAADMLGVPTQRMAMADIPGFTPPTASGHGGQVLALRVGSRNVLVLLGRIH